MSAVEEEGYHYPSVIDDETGFPVAKAGSDGGTEIVLVTKSVDENGEVLEDESGTKYERSDDPMIVQEEGTAAAQTAAAESATQKAAAASSKQAATKDER